MSSAREYLEYLKGKRKRERSNNLDLLWENLALGTFARLFPYTSMDSKSKIALQGDYYFPTLSQFYIVLSHTCEIIQDPNLRSILQYGAARRYGSLRQAVITLMEIAPPRREHKLTLDEAQSLSSSVMLIYVHVVGIIDAFSIAFKRLKQLHVNETKADLLNPKFRALLDAPRLDLIFRENDAWMRRVKNELRNRFVHRIPPYVPYAEMNPEEADRFSSLEEEKFRKLAAGDLGGADSIKEEQDRIGRFKPVLIFSDNDSVMLLHPTILDDVYRFNVIVLDLLDEFMASQS